MRVLIVVVAGAILAGAAAEVVAADAAAGPQLTVGDRVAASPTTARIKRASESAGAGVGTALGVAGDATTRAGTAVGGAFGTLDTKMTGWLGRLGLRSKASEPRPGWGNRDD